MEKKERTEPEWAPFWRQVFVRCGERSVVALVVSSDVLDQGGTYGVAAKRASIGL